MTRHESTGKTPSLSAVLPNGPCSDFSLSSSGCSLFFFLFLASRLSLANASSGAAGLQGSHAGFVPGDVHQDEGL